MGNSRIREYALGSALVIGGLAAYYNRDKLPSLTNNKANPEASPSPSPKTRVMLEGEAGGLYGDVENGAKDINSKTYRNTTSDRPEDQPNPANEVPLREKTLKQTPADDSGTFRLTPNGGAISPRGTQTENRYESKDEYMYATSPNGKQVSLLIHHYKEGNPVVVGNYQNYKLNDRVGIVERSAGGNVTTTVFRPQ